MNRNSEIQNLQTIHTKFDIEVTVLDKLRDLTKVKFILLNQIFSIYIQDEYEDLKINSPLLHFCLVLRELEIYKESKDYLNWCNTQGVDAINEQLRQYYMRMSNTYTEIEEIIGKIDSQINDLDFQLNSGAAWELRNNYCSF